MSRLVQGCAPERHDAVADELVERAAVAEHHGDLAREVAVEQVDDLLRRPRLGQRREAADIREQHADLAIASGQRLDGLAAIDQTAHDLGIQEAPEHRHGVQPGRALASPRQQRRESIEGDGEDDGLEHRQHHELLQREPRRPQQQQAPGQQAAAHEERAGTGREGCRRPGDQQQGQRRRPRRRRLVHRAGVLQVVDGRGENLDSGVQARKRRDALVAQARRGGADHHDRVAELVRGTSSRLRLQIIEDIREAHVTKASRAAAERQPDGILRRHAPAEIVCQSRGQREQLPAVQVVVDVVAPADAVGVLEVVDRAGAPGLRRQCQRRQQRSVRGRIGDRRLLQAQRVGHFA